jgi:hypothetical protein
MDSQTNEEVKEKCWGITDNANKESKKVQSKVSRQATNIQ